ncbi:hypothetical protein F5Y13DRAFT_182446 [Hypoxylon sp. FL1857]|nr:hypothetical protein F5Y13DRAFT_182446 [Hypoxylon sp. FL1857]
MAIEVAMNTPLADALNMAIQPKLVEVGWASGGADDSALSEYIILMLVNGKTQDQIAAELAGDLLSLGPDDPGARDFAKWLFDQIESLNSQLNGAPDQLHSAGGGGATQIDMPSTDQDADMTMAVDGPELNAPTGPRSMRNPTARGGREKRLFGQMAKAMDRSHDSVLHRVRANGNERINSHRAPPTGPRGGFGRGNTRMQNNRANGIAAHLNQAVANMPPQMQGPHGMNGMNDMSWMMPPGSTDQIMQMIQQQNEMIQHMQQQLSQPQNQTGGRPHGRSLFDRVQNPRGGRRGGHANGHRLHQADPANANEAGAENEDVEMGQSRREPPNPETTVCRFNLACTNKDCKFAHQSPAAPPNTTVDVNDVCSFGAACKNRKCVGRHPSPAAKRVYQNEQECKFYPNCTNPNCPFKHPEMPPCRNGGDCAVEGCKFTHLQTMCKYKPCTNRFCPYKHEEGQRGTFQDKVWTADGSKEHVSERKFVDSNAPEELVVPGGENEDVFISLLRSAYRNTRHGARSRISILSASRQLSSLAARSATVHPSISQQLDRTRIEKLTRARSRPFATVGARNGKPREIAILGGGMTGLTTAHYLARYAQNANITLYEGSERLGGWVHGHMARVGDGKFDKVLFQHGPRMLQSNAESYKYDDLVFYDVLANLGLEDALLPGSNVHNDRYLYYPDHLVKMFSKEFTFENVVDSIKRFLTEPLWSGTLKAVVNLGRHRAYIQRIDKLVARDMNEDESVAHYMERVFRDDRIVRNVVSGALHGIYGGDVYKLSVKQTIFERFWRTVEYPIANDAGWVEAKNAALLFDMGASPNLSKIAKCAQRALACRTMMFQDGLLTLAHGLASDLKHQKNVTIKTGSRVTSLSYNDDKVLVTTADKPGEAKQYDKVISTIFSKQLAELVEPEGALPSLADTHAVTIMVVNLWFPNPHLLDGKHGFGYLVPQSTPENDECVLGVLFDSDLEVRSEIPGTKLTVMLGGHYWDGWDVYPSEEMGREMAFQAVQQHLGISPDEKVISTARLCRDCIPQHYVGHRARMRSAHYELLAAFKGQLAVAGPSYTGIGVIPAMRAGFDVAMRVALDRPYGWYRRPEDVYTTPESYQPLLVLDHVGETGLETFTEKERDTVAPIRKATLPHRRWSAPPKRYNFIVGISEGKKKKNSKPGRDK